MQYFLIRIFFIDRKNTFSLWKRSKTVRLRKVKGADEAVAASPYVIQKSLNCDSSLKKLFGNEHPLHIEIGMGKGRFLMELAKVNPAINYIGIERYTSVLIKAIKKMEDEPLPNLYFICMDASNLEQYFAPGDVERIYLNFSDPWPKDRHARRRLTSTEYLKRYDKILSSDGLLEFKTDNEALFDFSLESIKKAGWRLLDYTRDLHHDVHMSQGNIMTEYEEKFSSIGKPIYKLIACR